MQNKHGNDIFKEKNIQYTHLCISNTNSTALKKGKDCRARLTYFHCVFSS